MGIIYPHGLTPTGTPVHEGTTPPTLTTKGRSDRAAPTSHQGPVVTSDITPSGGSRRGIQVDGEAGFGTA